MHLLAVDTTTSWGSIAVLRDRDVLGEVRLHAEGGHSTTLLPAIDALLRLLGKRPGDLDAFAVTLGPGSFTGVRVGISTVQGLVLGSGRPAVGVIALDALAEKMQGTAGTLVPMMDAYRDQVFAGLYDSGARALGEPAARKPEEWLEAVPNGAAVLGDGARRYRERIQGLRPDLVWTRSSLFLAAAVGRLAQGRLAAGEGVAADALRPFYLRGADFKLATVPAAPAPRE